MFKTQFAHLDEGDTSAVTKFRVSTFLSLSPFHALKLRSPIHEALPLFASHQIRSRRPYHFLQGQPHENQTSAKSGTLCVYIATLQSLHPTCEPEEEPIAFSDSDGKLSQEWLLVSAWILWTQFRLRSLFPPCHQFSLAVPPHNRLEQRYPNHGNPHQQLPSLLASRIRRVLPQCMSSVWIFSAYLYLFEPLRGNILLLFDSRVDSQMSNSLPQGSSMPLHCPKWPKTFTKGLHSSPHILL